MQKNETISFITGTGFSGSGCVLDWLREQEEVVVKPSRPFSYFFRKGGKLNNFNSLKLVLQLLTCQTPNERTKLIENGIDFLDGFISHQRSISHRLKEGAKRFNTLKQLRSLLTKGKWINFKKQKQLNPEIKSRYPDWISAAEDIAFLKHLASVQGDPSQLQKDIESWIEERIGVDDCKYLVLDKTFPKGDLARAERLMELLPQVKIVVVVRDVYDQLINMFLISEAIDINDDKALKLAIEKRLNAITNTTAYFSKLKLRFPKRVIPVEFERFVLNHTKEADRLGALLNIPVKNEGYSNLDLRISKKNVGLKNIHVKLTELIDTVPAVVPAKESVADFLGSIKMH